MVDEQPRYKTMSEARGAHRSDKGQLVRSSVNVLFGLKRKKKSLVICPLSS